MISNRWPESLSTASCRGFGESTQAPTQWLYECSPVPTIVICQNKRETTHAFASEENGVSNLGLWDDTTCEKLLFSFAELATSEEKRNEIRRKLLGLDTVAGKQRVVSRLHRLMASGSKVKEYVLSD